MTDNSRSPFSLEEPNIDWRDGDLPFSRNFEDIYFPESNGPEIVWHDFIAPNNLPDAWKYHSCFTIAELGFGTGLNFFYTAKLWTESRDHSSWLHFISCELQPLQASDIKRALSRFPEIIPLVEKTLERYPIRTRGFHRIILEKERVSLTLLFGEASESLKQLSARVNAWFLDGFAPSKNEELWCQDIFQQMARLSAPKATFGTYAAAGFVRRGLEAVGFDVERIPGHGNKRESLKGKFLEGTAYSIDVPKKVAVIGAGLAGLSIASAISKRGCSVSLFEQESKIASKASGNKAGVLLPYITEKPTDLSRLYLNGYNFSRQALLNLQDSGEHFTWRTLGVTHFPSTERLKRLYSNLSFLQLPEELVQKAPDHEAFLYPLGSYVAPIEICKALLSQSKTENLFLNSSVGRVERIGNSWNIFGTSIELLDQADTVIVANAHQARELGLLSWLPIEPVRGQIFTGNGKNLPNSVTCYDGYTIPLSDSEFAMGATYSHHDLSAEIREEENQELISRTRKWLLDFESKGPYSSRVCFRTSSYDRLPLIGEAPDVEDLGSIHKGFYIALGFGSRGFISCPLAGEIIASKLFSEPQPIESDLLQKLSPMRYIKRCIKRGETHLLDTSSDTKPKAL